MKKKIFGFTMIEILVVVGIIAILVSILVPAITVVHKKAKEAKQRAQLNSIEMALLAFKNDYGDYPFSNRIETPSVDYYYGAQKLSEALLGQDLLGFHPDSIFLGSGLDQSGVDLYPTPFDPVNNPLHKQNLQYRKGPYLDPTKTNAFRIGDLYTLTEYGPLNSDTFVICDEFPVKKVILLNNEIVMAGTPILYYKANPSGNPTNPVSNAYSSWIYNPEDNVPFISILPILNTSTSGPHPLSEGVYYSGFCQYIRDYKVTSTPWWPHRADSYLLISAGEDGLYGTKDDICNFPHNPITLP